MSVQAIKDFLHTHRWFILPYALFLILAGSLQLFVPKPDLHLQLNRWHSPAFDLFFKTITLLGDGSVPFVAATVLAVFSFRKAIQIGLSGAVSGLLAQFLKRFIFTDIVRPSVWFGNTPDFHWVSGIDLHAAFSFPSGHAATIFSLCVGIMLFSAAPARKLSCFFIALLVAYSRVYLSQHFLIDIYFGSLLGVLITILIYLWMEKKRAAFLDTSILQLINKSRP